MVRKRNLKRMGGREIPKQQAGAPLQQFTCFPKLPPEIRDMVWDIALSEPCVIIASDIFKRDVKRPRRFISPVGNIPAQIALSCRDAAARWDRLCPVSRVMFCHDHDYVQVFPQLAGLRVRLREENTILYSHKIILLMLYLDAAQFLPSHLAVACQKSNDDYLSTTIDGSDFPHLRAQYEKAETLIKVRGFTTSRVIDNLIRMVSRECPDSLFGARGREVMKCTRPRENGGKIIFPPTTDSTPSQQPRVGERKSGRVAARLNMA